MTDSDLFNVTELLYVLSNLSKKYLNEPLDINALGFQIFVSIDEAYERGITLQVVLSALNKHISLVKVEIKKLLAKPVIN